MDATQQHPEERWSARSVVLAVAGAALIATLSSLGNPFILDDRSKILGNPDIRQLSELLGRLVYPYESHQLLERNDPSRPLVFALYGLVHAAAGLAPWAYRLLNLLLHAANAVGVFLLLDGLLSALAVRRARLAATLAGLFFAVAPIQTATASYCYATSDLLCATLSLVVLYLATERERPGLAAFALVGALLSKQSAVVVPALVVLWDFGRRCHFDVKLLLPRLPRFTQLWLIVFGYLLLRQLYFGSLGDLEGRGNTAEFSLYAAFQPYALLRYLQLSLVPVGLAIDHYIGPATVAAPWRYGALGLVVAALAALVAHTRQLLAGRAVLAPWANLLWFGAVFYAIAVAPTSSFFPTVDFLVERRVYLANLSLALAVGSLGSWVIDRHRADRGIAICAAYLFILLGTSHYRHRAYATSEGAWRSVLAVYPKSIRALINLGIELSSQGRAKEAAECFGKVLERDPSDVYALTNLAGLFNNESSPLFDRPKARQLFEAVARLKPTFAPAYYELGRLAQLQGDLAQAEPYYQQALRYAPRDAQTHNNLGLLYLHQGRLADARRHLEISHQIDANYGPAQANLELLRTREMAPNSPPPSLPPDAQTRGPEIPIVQVDPSIILPLLNKAIAEEPKNPKPRLQLADYCYERKLDCAKEQYQGLLELEPSNEHARKRLELLK